MALRTAIIALCLAFGLSACAETDIGELFTGSEPPPPTPEELAQSQADLALAALAKGDYQSAEIHVQQALEIDPRNPYGLLSAGILYQNTGRTQEAGRAYQDIMALRPQQLAAVGTWFRQRPQTITDIAASNLEILAMLPSAGPTEAALATAANPGANPAAMPDDMMDDSDRMAADQPTTAGGLAQPEPPLTPETDRNRVMRFVVLERLLQEGLITSQEYTQRRSNNIGALLLMTQPPPAQGLQLPPPEPDQVVGRLRALQTAFENQETTSGQYAAERVAILESLMPAMPLERANRLPPPPSFAVAAAMEERIDSIRSRGLITREELAAEKAGIQAAARGQTPAVAGASGSGAASTGSGRGAHLASYRTEAMARRGWDELSRKFPSELGGLRPMMTSVQVAGKGNFVRLVAQTTNAAGLCQALKAKGQYCEVR